MANREHSRGEGLYRGYLLVVLAAIFVSNNLDRVVLGIVLQDIKSDLHLSDTHLGFLTGIAFALFYSLMGIPIARWADRGNRVTIIALTTALWSVAVALCSLATNFVQMMLVRIVAAVGEAGCIPPAHSLIATHFSRGERPRAVARYMLGAPLSAVIGYFAAGWLNQLYGWRTTFVVLGLPGLVLAGIAWFTLREPRRQSEELRQHRPSASSTMGVAAMLWRNRTFRHLLLYFAIASFFNYGLAQWKPAFFIRSFGLKTGELGTWLGLIYGAAGLLGMYWGGEWASRLAPKDERRQLRYTALLLCAFAVISAAIYLSPNHLVAFIFMALATFGAATTVGPLFATIQTLVPDDMRAMSIALLYLFANLVGMGLGPLAAGILSDNLRPVFGEESLRYALLLLCPGYCWAAWHLWLASRTVRLDIEAAEPKGGQ